jgi:hypothetical protein
VSRLCSCGRMPCEPGYDLCSACEQDYYYDFHRAEYDRAMREQYDRDMAEQYERDLGYPHEYEDIEEEGGLGCQPGREQLKNI